MTTVTIDDELVAKLTSCCGKVTLTDHRGKVIGYFVPLDKVEQYRQSVLARVFSLVTDEKTRLALADPQQYDAVALLDVLKGLGG